MPFLKYSCLSPVNIKASLINWTKPLIWGWQSALFLMVTFFLIFSIQPDATMAGRGAAYPYILPNQFSEHSDQVKTVVGHLNKYTIQNEDTFLDLAREFDLGINELIDLYPNQDPWIPEPGLKIVLPQKWILPDPEQFKIIINLAEMRLYLYYDQIKLVKTYPVAIGNLSWPTPLGTFTIQDKSKDPVWHIPNVLQEKYKVASIPPGPKNPLGKFWLGLGNSGCGIHGTNNPWSVGRMVTHGCIRMYPEDIIDLFSSVNPGDKVKIIYQPVKFGFLKGKVYIEVHKDIYQKIDKLYQYAIKLLSNKELVSLVDSRKLYKALQEKTGLPINISK